MHSLVKMAFYAVLFFVINTPVSSTLAQEVSESATQTIEDNSVQLHWKKLNQEDFLIRRSNVEESIAIVPVRGQNLVKIIANNEPTFSVSNGSGLFQEVDVHKTAGDHFVFRNNNTGLVWLRLKFSRSTDFTAYTAESDYYSAIDFLYPLNKKYRATGADATSFTLSNNSDRVEKVFIDDDSTYTLDLNQPGVLLFRHQIDYEQIDSQFDVLYQVAWQDAEQKNIRNYTTRPEVQRLYQARCLHQLGQRKDTLITIEKAGRYTFSSTQPVQAEFYLLSDKQVLLDRRNTLAPRLEENIEQQNYANEIVNNFNTFIDQNIYQEALSKLIGRDDNKQILSLLRAKHSFFKPLHPVSLQEQKMLYAYYSIYSDPELPSNRNAEFYLNENLTDAITKKISTGYFYPFGKIGQLEYELASETFENKLRIAVANTNPESSKLTLLFDTGEEVNLAIESSFTQLAKKLNVVDVGLTILNQNQFGELATLSSEFASKKPVAPFLNTVTGLIDIPVNAKSFSVKSNDSDVWVSIAYPQRSFYRSFEYGPIKDALLNKQGVNKLTEFVQSYQYYKNLQNHQDTENNLNSIFDSLTDLSLDSSQNLQAWTPYYREIYNADIKLPEQANTQIKLFELEELKSLNAKLNSKRQNRLRRDTLLAHAHYAKKRTIREYAFREFTKLALQSERYRQVLDLAHILLIRHSDAYVLNTITEMHQHLDSHRKAIFYSSLNPDVVNVDNILASLFYLRQWGLFEDLHELSENSIIWQNLKLYQLTALEQHLGDAELAFIDSLGYSWVNEDRFLLNYKNSQLIQSVATLSNKQIAYIDNKNSASLTVKGPLSLRLRVANEFADKRYVSSNFKLKLKTRHSDNQVSFRSVPANSWLNASSSLVGSFGEVDLQIPVGVQEYELTTQAGSAYVYVENKRNLLGLNLGFEETVDAEFVRENAILYNRKDANKNRTIGYLKSSCKRLRKLVQSPVKTFQAVDIDLNQRQAWIDQQVQKSALDTANNNNWLQKALDSSSSLSIATSLGNACAYNKEYSEACVETLHSNMLSGETSAALTLLDYIDRYPNLDLSVFRADVFDRFEWQLLNTVRQSDGRISLDSQYLQEDNVYLNALKDNFIASELPSLFITGRKIQGFKFDQDNKVNSFEFKRISQNQVFLQAITINYQIDDEPIQSFELSDSSHNKVFTLTNNQSDLKFWLAEDSASEFISIFHADAELIKQSKEYFVATPDTPIMLAINGPQRLKIVTQELNGPRKIEERQVPREQEVLSFNSTAEETYYRFFSLKPSFSESRTKIAQFKESSQTRSIPSNPYRNYALSTSLSRQEKLADVGGEIYNSKKSSYDLSLIHGRSLDEDQDSENSTSSQFTDIQAQYRYFSPDRDYYWSGDAKVRTGTNFNALYAQARLDWLPKNSPFEYSAYVNDWLFSGESIDLNAFSAGLSAAYNINYKYNHRFTTRVAGFYRDSFGDDLDIDNFNQVQSSIWSLYKQDHKFGLSASQRWTYDAYLDTQFYADAKLQTNENPISIDYLQASFGYRQLYDTASLEASIVNRNFFSDDDREDAEASNRFRLSADWLLRPSQDGAFKLGLSYFNNFSADTSAYAINFTWLYHRGNYLEDYRPGEYRFRKTRERRLLESTFNTLENQ